MRTDYENKRKAEKERREAEHLEEMKKYWREYTYT